MLAVPHHFYKVPFGTPVASQIQSFIARCDEASEKARVWALDHGASSYYESPDGMAGGIAALVFDDTIAKPHFERIESADGQVFFVPEEGSDEEREMYGLPIVSETELIAILQFRPRVSPKTGKNLPFTFGSQTPVIFACSDYYFFDMPYECQAPGLLPVTEKVFYRSRMKVINAQ